MEGRTKFYAQIQYRSDIAEVVRTVARHNNAPRKLLETRRRRFEFLDPCRHATLVGTHHDLIRYTKGGNFINSFRFCKHRGKLYVCIANEWGGTETGIWLQHPRHSNMSWYKLLGTLPTQWVCGWAPFKNIGAQYQAHTCQ